MEKKVRTLCMYLPQFHKVAENDQWWGEGFTEWTTVRGAEALFEGHMQPIKPLNDNYYNLLDKDTMEWQASLMKKYGIDGQCFYHYYFKDGRHILEKPAENLLQWKDIDMPFCFCWANGRWARTWSNLTGNSWADKYEVKDKSESDGVLIEQRYGREEEWRAHFEYLLPFFKDERYIRIDGAPVFIFFAAASIPCLPQMIQYWNELAHQENLNGLYFIGVNTSKKIEGLNALMLFAPHKVCEFNERIDGIVRLDYDAMWKNISNAGMIDEHKTYYCAVPNVDDTPRRGRHDGVLFKNFTIEKFYDGMCRIYEKSIAAGNEFVFINAWNEWGEGTQLEPDEYYGFSKLEAVSRAQKYVFENDAVQAIQENTAHNVKIANQPDYTVTAKCFDLWMEHREKGINIASYLERYGIKHIAVYGYGMLAKHLIPELEGTNIVIDYFIDRSRRKNPIKYEIRSVEGNLPPVDAVIVTVVDEFDGIYQMLRERMNCKFFSLYEIVSELP